LCLRLRLCLCRLSLGLAVTLIKRSSVDNRNAERLKIAFIDYADVGFNFLAGLRNRITIDVKRVVFPP